MTYFQNIQSLADLKKEYRRLAMLHHPDKGGDTALMQQVNTEFGKLFEVWKDKPCVSTAPTGYEHDFQGATAKEYTEYVYNEYRWKGRNYNGQSAPEITELVRAWLKETYPRYTFSVRKDGYSSILIRLMKADFEAFTRESGKVQGDINHYNIQASDSLTDRAKEVMTELDEQIDMALPRRLTLDLSGLSFTDSSGIAVLIRVSRRMEQIKGELIVRGVPPQPWKVFQAAGLHKLIRFEQEEPAAAGEEDVHK